MGGIYHWQQERLRRGFLFWLHSRRGRIGALVQTVKWDYRALAAPGTYDPVLLSESVSALRPHPPRERGVLCLRRVPGCAGRPGQEVYTFRDEWRCVVVRCTRAGFRRGGANGDCLCGDEICWEGR